MSDLPLIRRGVSALLLTPEGKLVIQLRDDKPGLLFPAHWATLGGAIEDDETPDEAMRRELMEEIEPAPPVTFWRYMEHQFVAYGKQRTIANYVFVGDLPCPLDEIKLFEGQRLAAFSADQIAHIPVAFGLESVFETFFREYLGMTRDDYD